MVMCLLHGCDDTICGCYMKTQEPSLTPPPRFDMKDALFPFNEGDLSNQLNEFSRRMSETVVCLKEWHTMNYIGLFDKGQIPDEFKELVDKTVKNTTRILREWRAIPEDANLQSGGSQT